MQKNKYYDAIFLVFLAAGDEGEPKTAILPPLLRRALSKLGAQRHAAWLKPVDTIIAPHPGLGGGAGAAAVRLPRQVPERRGMFGVMGRVRCAPIRQRVDEEDAAPC
jgi:hypothetical protein